MNADYTWVFQLMLLLWIALVALCIRRTARSREGSVGIPTSFLLVMSFMYSGAFVYAVPGYSHLRSDGSLYLIAYDFDEVTLLKGLACSLLAVTGFVLGAGTLTHLATRNPPVLIPQRWDSAYVRFLISILGAFSFASYTLHYAGASFPMSDAILELGRNLAVGVICIGAISSLIAGGQYYWRWLGVALVVPAYYLIGYGFVSYGFLFLSIFLGFWLCVLARKRMGMLKGVLVALAVSYALITLFVGWMTFREQIRAVIWQGGDIQSTLEVLSNAIRQAELFSPFNFDALDWLLTRLNMPLFVGKMMERHEWLPELRQYGATLIMLPLAVIPRFLWPAKPERGGNQFMAEHTGLNFSDAASFGTGSVFEFYVNFGYVGVFLGFLAIGWFLRSIDKRAADALRRGEFLHFMRFMVVGLIFLDPLLRPFFMVSGATIGWILMSVIIFALRQRGRRKAPPQPMPRG